MEKYNIKWNVPIDASGYSQCGQDYVLALSQNNNVKLIPDKVSILLDGKGIDCEQRNSLQALTKTEFNPQEDYINVCHSVPDRFYLDSKAILNIGYTVCETEKIPNRWPFLCNKMDAIFTASEYCKNIFIKNGVTKPIYVIPHCHNPDKFHLNLKYNIKNLKSYNFLFMADMTPRKGWKDLVKAFCEEFDKTEDVSLTFKVYYHDFSLESQENCKEKIRNYAKSIGYSLNENTAKFLFYGNCLPTKCVNQFINTFDCLVSPHKGEGWGLLLSQSMLLKKQVIATEYSGNLEFMDKKNSFLIPIKGFTPVEDEMIRINPNYAGLNWPIIDISSLKKTMRYVYENKQQADIISENAYTHIYNKYNYKAVSNLIEKSIKELINNKYIERIK